MRGTDTACPSRPLDDLGTPGTGRRVEVAGARRVAGVGGQLAAGQPAGEPVVRQRDRSDPGGDVRLVLGQPAQLRDRERRREHRPGELGASLRSAELVDELLGRRRRAEVVPEQRRSQHLTGVVEDHHPVLLGADTDGIGAFQQAVAGALESAPTKRRGRSRCRRGAAPPPTRRSGPTLRRRAAPWSTGSTSRRRPPASFPDATRRPWPECRDRGCHDRGVTASVGEPIARGSRSTVHEFGNDAVAKVPLPDTPEAWIRIEAGYAAAVHQAGAPVPEFLGFGEHEGRTISIYRRAFGELMWDAVLDHPERADDHARRLVGLQELLASLVPPIVLPAQVDRLRSKIRIAARFADPDLEDALGEIPSVQRVVLCHGDLHPSNVILSADGPMVVDWFDASRGDPIGDVARDHHPAGEQFGRSPPGRCSARPHDPIVRGVRRCRGRFVRVRSRDARALACGRRRGPGRRTAAGRGVARPVAPLVERRLSAGASSPQPASISRRSGSNTEGAAARTSPPFSGQGSSTPAPASDATSAPAE